MPRGRRRDGEGSVIFDKSKNLWYGFTPRLTNGQRAKTRGCASETEALYELGKMLHDGRQGKVIPTRRRMMNELFDAWIADVVSQKQLATRLSYEQSIRVHLRPAFGMVRIDDLSRQTIQQFANAKRDSGLSPRTVRLALTVLAMAYKVAREWGWTNRDNPAADIPVRKDDDQQAQAAVIDALSEDQVEQLLEGARGHAMEWLIQFGLWSGLRRGELGALQWKDIVHIDGAPYLQVRRTLVWLTGEPWRFKNVTKTTSGLRTFRLLPAMLEALEGQRARVATLRAAAGEKYWTDHDLVFPSELGGPIYPGNINRAQRQIEDAQHIERNRVHDWRHTAATRLLAAGVSDRVVMEILGWKDRTMLDRYQHVRTEMLDEAYDRMLEHYPAAAGSGAPTPLTVRSKFARRPHSRRKGARLDGEPPDGGSPSGSPLAP